VSPQRKLSGGTTSSCTSTVESAGQSTLDEGVKVSSDQTVALKSPALGGQTRGASDLMKGNQIQRSCESARWNLSSGFHTGTSEFGKIRWLERGISGTCGSRIGTISDRLEWSGASPPSNTRSGTVPARPRAGAVSFDTRSLAQNT
jgi:hypothetical protein